MPPEHRRKNHRGRPPSPSLNAVENRHGGCRPRPAATMDARESFWALVLAGGDGTRLQSLTRLIAGAPIPKQYCRILGPRSLLETTLLRIAPLVMAERTLAIIKGTITHGSAVLLRSGESAIFRVRTMSSERSRSRGRPRWLSTTS